jgi:hypothetical protein
MKEIKVYLIVIAILLFVLNYRICDYFYYVDENLDSLNWWRLKHVIYCFVFALITQSYVINTEKGALRFFLQILTGLSAANVLDQYNFKIFTFEKQDIGIIVVTVLFALADYHKEYIKCKTIIYYYKSYSKIKKLIKRIG